MKKKEVNIGDKFGQLTILEEVSPIIISNKPRRMFKCLCSCGNEITTQLALLTSGKTQSCGCYQKIRAAQGQFKHGLVQHPLYNTWKNMKKRCYNISYPQYKDYGGRGINICNDWRNNFKNFYDWAINNNWKKSLSIDRINNNQGYTPENCRWVNAKVQNNNTRKNYYIYYNNQLYTLSTLSKKLNIPYNIVRYRISNCKWSLEQLIKKYNNDRN